MTVGPAVAGGSAAAAAPVASAALPIRAAGVGFRYAGASDDALDGVDLDLPAGQVLLIVGPSGSGKSTLARAIAGLVPAEFPGAWRGSLRVGDVEVATATRTELAARVGIVFQDPGSQLVMERVTDDVAFGLENRAWPVLAMRGRVPEALAEVGLGGFEERRSTRLSGGEQQRLALAGVLAARPGVLVLDEPTANLDVAGTAALYERLGRLAGVGSTTIVLVEHRVEPAWSLAHLVLALDHAGRPIDLGPPADVLARSRGRLDDAGIWRPDGAPVARVRPDAGYVPAAVLDVDEAWYDYVRGEPVLHGVSIAVGRGERVALRGPNGSGKTTLLRLAMGLLRPGAGAIRVLGRDPARLTGRRLAEMVGYVVQDPELGFMADTVREEIELGLPADAGPWVSELARRLDLSLDRFADRNPYRLSGGEQRRLSLVTALARKPALLVLDEPTFGQDRLGHEALVATLDELAANGTAILAATHDDRFVATWADRTIDIEDGWLVGVERRVGPPATRSRRLRLRGARR
ncbi:MAG TPA: ATP-binding cassette domain-containing protein [Candidatus Limnocylindrales bacterium]|nr:ATP-binding cassette domain-containing protein [Candidatus Limnocylindrales bacterium]